MNTPERPIASAAYALFALEQPLSLLELADAAQRGELPLATTHTPRWFAAAARDDSNLLEIAPELLVLPADLDSAARVDVSGIDLIHVYAPELLAAAAEVEAQLGPGLTTLPPGTPEMPRTSTQLGLLSELNNLDD